MRGSLILKTDSYKVTHWRQYPPGTTGVYSYMESRGGRWPTSVFFGLQYLLREYVVGAVVTRPGIDEADEFFSQHLGDRSLFNREGWEYVLRVHGGRLPVRIKAVPEGSPVWNRNVLMTIENTDPRVAWLTNYLESLLVQVWYPTTVATQSREMKRIWQEYLVRTGDPSLIAFKLHDFGYRGSTSDESAALGGAAHLVNFTGTDNLAGCELAMRYYRAQMPGFSIPAAEHSTITAWGRERELEAYANMLRAYPDSPLIAVVSDSYDIFHAVSELWGRRLRDAVMARRGAVVIRPDSGKPDEVVLSVLRRLGAAFGARMNAKGFKMLDDHVRVIQGDGIDYDTIRTILEAMALDGWSADNLTMGSGGGLLQKMDRDTQRFAFKCSAVRIGDTWSPVSKAPLTDPGKNSKAGRLKLVRIHGVHTTVADDTPGTDEMVEVFRDGELLKEWTFDEVRERAALTT
jgi:nicotinamide phosphoribosyltransferase